MNIESFVGATMTTVAIFIVGFVLYQQNERHFAESQRWFEVCTAQKLAQLKDMVNYPTTPEETKAQAQQSIDNFDANDYYSTCYREWHAGN